MKYKNYFCDEVIKQIQSFFSGLALEIFRLPPDSDLFPTPTRSKIFRQCLYSAGNSVEKFFTGHPSWKLQSYDNPVKRNWIWNLPQTCNRNAIIAQQKAQSYFHKTNLEAGEQCTSLSRILYHKGHFAFSFIKKLEG